VTVDAIKSPVTKVDEFALFSNAIGQLANARPMDIGVILGELSGDQNKQLKSLLQTKRIPV